MKIKHRPIHPVRQGVRGEVVFSRLWERLMNGSQSDVSLGSILRSFPGKVGQRQASVAASIVCWLGTNVGLHFLEQARKLQAAVGCEDAYVAAWAIHNQRVAWNNSGLRAIEMHITLANQRVTCDADDLEVAEHVMAWFGTPCGQRFLQSAEVEIDRYRKLDTLAAFHRNGVADCPAAKKLEDELSASPT